jgi:thiamine biosynthesis lipoprotein
VPVHSEIVMGTVVTIQVVDSGSDAVPGASAVDTARADAAIARAFGWFHEIEARCTRFDQRSELMQLTVQASVPVPASAILFEAVRFALMLAEETGGAFDPTVGHRMEARGFNREHRTGAIVRGAVTPDDDVSYRDVELDAERRTITLRRPLTLDLGAVAKGLAVDTAARELAPFKDFAIDAGGDLYLGGSNPDGDPWYVGIRHPRRDDELIASLRVSNQAVCTSGDYERRIPGDGSRQGLAGHHILDPRTGASAQAVASATVVASGAMLADALATAAFVLGPEAGIQLLTRLGVDGLIVTPELDRYETGGLCHGS